MFCILNFAGGYKTVFDKNGAPMTLYDADGTPFGGGYDTVFDADGNPLLCGGGNGRHEIVFDANCNPVPGICTSG
jgi:hypothetical protein